MLIISFNIDRKMVDGQKYIKIVTINIQCMPEQQIPDRIRTFLGRIRTFFGRIQFRPVTKPSEIYCYKEEIKFLEGISKFSYSTFF